ncbi:L-lactate permease [Weissella minor]|uniref:L-lactate permease n=1 Tax=Weissella minor TaxID=1620 RepID=UPI003AF23831
MQLLVSMIPILVPVILLGVFNMSAVKGMSISAILIIISSIFVWSVPANAIGASMLQGIHKTLPIAWILFGALMLLRALEYTGSIERINIGFTNLTQDMRLQAILVAFLFGSLIEGVSGFGTPAMVTAPLLITLGFKPLSAVVLALVSDSTAVSFGAVGTPITVGLSNATANAAELNAVSHQVVTLELISGTFVPMLLMMLLVVFLPNQYTSNKMKSALEVAPWTLMIGLVYSVTAFFTQTFIGYELTSVVTPIVVLVFAMATIKFNILLPKNTKQNPWIQYPRSTEEAELKSDMSLFMAWLPYVLVVSLLVLPKLFAPINTLLNSAIDLSVNNILGFKGISSDWLILASPGTVLLLVSIVTLLMHKKSPIAFQSEVKDIAISMKSTLSALVVTLIMVQVFTNTNFNTANLVSMPNYLASFMATHLNNVWLMIAPVLGAVGSFVTGSATVSTLTFSSIQANVATDAGLDKAMVLAAQVIGGAIGNMICIHNIVSVNGVVGFSGQEGQVLRKTAIPAVIYIVLLIISIYIFL